MWKGFKWVLDWIGRLQLIWLLIGGGVTAIIAKVLEAPSWVIFGLGLIGSCIGLFAINIWQNYQAEVRDGKPLQLIDMLGRPYETRREKPAVLRYISPAVIIVIVIIILSSLAYLNYKPSEQVSARVQHSTTTTETGANQSTAPTKATGHAPENFPLLILASTRGAIRQPGTIIGGIPWQSSYGELKVVILNGANVDYQGIDLQIVPDVAVTAAAQLTNIQGVSISINHNPDIAMEMVNQSSGERVDRPLSIIASTVGYQLRCGLLPARASVELIMAVVSMRENKTTADVDKLLRVNFSDGSSVWSAHPKHTEKIFGNKPVPNVVKVTGRYTVKQKEYPVSESITAKDIVLDAMREIPKQNAVKK